MMRTWEEKVKFKFGNAISEDALEVTVPGVADNPALNIADGFHSMKAYIPFPPMLSPHSGTDSSQLLRPANF